MKYFTQLTYLAFVLTFAIPTHNAHAFGRAFSWLTHSNSSDSGNQSPAPNSPAPPTNLKPSPSPKPTVTPTVSPSPTPTQTPTSTPSPTPTPTQTPTSTPSPTPSPTQTSGGSATFPAPFTPARTVTVCASGCDYTLPSQAISAAQDYDLIQIKAGDYVDCAFFPATAAHLWVQGVGGSMPHIHDQVCGSKAIFVTAGQQSVIDNIEFSGMSISASDGNNGAGIRDEGVSLTVRNCFFHDGQEGILTDSPPASTDVLIKTRTSRDSVRMGMSTICTSITSITSHFKTQSWSKAIRATWSRPAR